MVSTFLFAVVRDVQRNYSMTGSSQMDPDYPLDREEPIKFGP